MKIQLFAILLAALLMIPFTGDISHAQELLPQCFNFEQLPLGQKYKVADTFPVTGAKVEAGKFQWSNGQFTADGIAVVENGGRAGGTGQEVHLNNINLAFALNTPLTSLSLLFGEYGGNLNIEINGDFLNFSDFIDIRGKKLGGVLVYVDDFGTGKGRLTFDGQVKAFTVGGQELWIDDPCGTPPPSDCVGFEGLPVSTRYKVGNVFKDNGISLTVEPFQWRNGQMTSTGFAAVDSHGKAGGTGKDLNINNANIRFDFGGQVRIVYLRFGEFGGNLNIEVNGDFRNIDDFAKIHNTKIGQALAIVSNGLGNDQGVLALIGTIKTLAIGGQELWIDDVCFCRLSTGKSG